MSNVPHVVRRAVMTVFEHVTRAQMLEMILQRFVGVVIKLWLKFHVSIIRGMFARSIKRKDVGNARVIRILPAMICFEKWVF